ncbi:MAG: hypothetical protein ACXIUW_11955 [Roseinatronobacter sp.]
MKTQWRVHVGAHKTATTHLQELLRANEDKLLQHGVDFLNGRGINSLLRADPSQKPAGLDILKALVKGQRPVRASKRYSREINALRRDQPVTIISQEDQLGFTQDLMRPHFYDGSQKFTILNSLPDRESVDIYLSIRSFETLFVSAFCEMLKPFHDARARLEARRRTLQDMPPSWFELANRLGDSFPDARIHVWKFEDYIKHPGFVVKALTGLELDDLDGRPAPDRTRSPSPKAIKLAEELDPALKVQDRMKIVQELFADHPKQSGETIELFSGDETAWLRDCYTRDLEKIEASARMTLVLPQAAALPS